MIQLRMLLLFVLLWAAAGSAAAKEKLVPAQFSSRADKTGFAYTPDAHGRINSAFGWVYSGISSNRGGLNVQKRMMTKDRSEFIYSGRLGKLSFSRRIRISPKHRGIRIVESFTNPTGRDVQASFILYAQPSRRSPQVITDRGRPANGVLGKDEGGMLCQVQYPSQMLLCYQLASPKVDARFKPNIVNQNNHNLQFHYTLVVPPGKTVSIAHGARVDQGKSIPPTARMKALFREMRSARWLRDLPADIRETIVNARANQGFGEGGTLASLESLLDVESGSTDRLAFGEETLLQGTARCESLAIEGTHGRSNVPFARIRAIVGGNSRSGPPGVYLRDGQRLGGKIEAEGLRFELASGMSIDLSIDKLDRLLLRRTIRPGSGTATRPGTPDDDGRLPAAATSYFLLQTHSGDRLRARRTRETLEASTQWGAMRIPFAELESLHPAGPDDPGHWIWLSDGSRFRAYLRGRTQVLETELFGRITISPQEIQRILAIRAQGDEPEEEELTQPHVRIVGGDRLVGRVELDALHFLTAGGVVPQSPSQLKHVELQGDQESVAPGEALRFRAEIWGGGHLTGELQEIVLPFQTAQGALRIPVRDIQEIHVPTPRVPLALRPRLQAWIADLGSENWAKREAASTALAELGELARTALETHLRKTQDPEVARRLRRLLDRL